jgi:hypothetical protein
MFSTENMIISSKPFWPQVYKFHAPFSC